MKAPFLSRKLPKAESKPQTASAGFLLFFLLSIGLLPAVHAGDFAATTEPVGRVADGIVTPVNQRITPAGKLVDLAGIRPQALALSPDGRLLVTAGLSQELLVLKPGTGEILQRVSLPEDKVPAQAPQAAELLSPMAKSQMSFAGLVFSPDGSRIYMANVSGDLKVFQVRADHTVDPLISFAIPAANAPARTAEIPTGIAVSRNGKKIYVAGNLSNQLFELDAPTGQVLRTWEVGVAPFDVVLAGNKVYVSNWGGRRPGAGDVTGPAGRGTLVRVDARSIASEGSVSVIDLDGTNRAEIMTGLHACAMALSPNGRWLVVANAGSDTLSVIDTHSDQVVETIFARQNPGDPFGAQPDALAFDNSGGRLFVCNGTQNAVAVFQFDAGNSKMLGLIPVGWFPAAVAFDARHNSIYAANLKNLGPGRTGKTGQQEFNTRQYEGSLSLVPMPSKVELAKLTQTALSNLRYPLLAEAALPARPGQAVQPVPERAGEPSLIKHVIYIIKENRTYDQVLGDISTGNGNSGLCTFGENVTPNLHKLVREFALLDNTYCCGILSADGHQWADTALATDYIEREFGGFPRSYPAGGDGLEGKDALAYSPAGFLWNDALAHGRTFADFGEFTTAHKSWKDPARTGKITFKDAYDDFMNGKDEIVYSVEPDIEALRPHMVTSTIGWDLNVPDVYRAAQFVKTLKEYEARAEMPNLVVLWLPNDHTSGTKPGSPTPRAQVADNDLSMGRVIDAVSHSSFWKDTCIFAVEDDPQNGWDHVSGYRTTAYVASPYTKRGAVVSTQYNQTSLIRTMELMLGLPPMNQMDATATPMFDCFTNAPDLTPFDAVTNIVALDEMNPETRKLSDPLLRKDAVASARFNLDKEDQCPEDVFNHILWRATMGSKAPYPAWAVKTVDDD